MVTEHLEAPANVVRDPSEVHRVFESLANAGDLEGLVALYEPEAALVPQPGQVVTGTSAVSEALRQLLAMGLTLQLKTRTVLISTDLALTSNHWVGTGEGGQTIEATTAEVLRRQADGHWLIAIDHAFFCDL
jgi:uncharacterized protein (TIGR02246 family)